MGNYCLRGRVKKAGEHFPAKKPQSKKGGCWLGIEKDFPVSIKGQEMEKEGGSGPSKTKTLKTKKGKGNWGEDKKRITKRSDEFEQGQLRYRQLAVKLRGEGIPGGDRDWEGLSEGLQKVSNRQCTKGVGGGIPRDENRHNPRKRVVDCTTCSEWEKIVSRKESTVVMTVERKKKKESWTKFL